MPGVIDAELQQAAAQCRCTAPIQHNGWTIDEWHTTSADVDRIVACYDALLSAGLGASSGVLKPIEALLVAAMVPVRDLLYNSSVADDEITRADFSELAAAVSLIAIDAWPAEALHMPNVPKGARNISDRGIDIMSAALKPLAPQTDFDPDEGLLLSSVKHSIQSTTTDVRSKLLASVGKELSAAYVAHQIRVLAGHLSQRNVAYPERLLYALTDFQDSARMQVHAIAVVDSKQHTDWTARLKSLPQASAATTRMRLILVDNLHEVQQKCP